MALRFEYRNRQSLEPKTTLEVILGQLPEAFGQLADAFGQLEDASGDLERFQAVSEWPLDDSPSLPGSSQKASGGAMGFRAAL